VENSKIRVQANILGIRKIYSNKDMALLTFHDSLDDEVYKKLIELIQSGSTGIKLTGTNKLNLDVSDQTNKREAVSALLHQLS
jgi:transcription-repair coupling factor (superfamily II helicase)